MAHRILLTGATGQVGGALLKTLGSFTSGGEPPEIVAPTRAELDLSHISAVRSYVREVAPRWIVNPGAYTAVDRAESETALAYAINAETPRVLGEEAARLGAVVVHFSTDYVFSGHGTLPWTETDIPEPQSVYGSTKLEGERALAASGATHFILRTSWVYGATGKNFLLTILRAAKDPARSELRVVDDQHGAPTWSYDLAQLATHVLQRGESLAEDLGMDKSLAEAVRPLSGIYHAAASGETTWFGFAKQAVGQERLLHPEESYAKLMPIPTVEYPTPARRPVNSRLNCDKLAGHFGWRMPDWRISLSAVLDELGRKG
jgi:dTDP-4-dehydrorhamnose reductase